MRAVVVAGSSLTAELDAAVVASADLLVAVDGGAEALSRVGLTPALLVGDLDSITVRTRETLEARGVEVVMLSTAKDETDTEAALRLLIARGADDIVVYGALGGPRLDHLVGNLLLLSSPWLAGVRVRMVDDRHEALLIKGDSTFAGDAGRHRFSTSSDSGGGGRADRGSALSARRRNPLSGRDSGSQQHHDRR